MFRKFLIVRLKQEMSRYLSCPAPDLISVLGWNSESFHLFSQTSDLITTLPHSSPNVFFPRVGVAWWARHIQSNDVGVFHLRLVLTHNNFSDMGWRPYAFWTLDRNGDLIRETVFSRNKKRKHVIVASEPPIQISSLAQYSSTDLDSIISAGTGANLAVSYMIMMAKQERAAGLNLLGRTLYLPLDFLVSCAREFANHEGIGSWISDWIRALLSNSSGRLVNPSGELEPAPNGAPPFVYNNSTHIALLSAFGRPAVLGGEKMAAYWGEIVESIGFANQACDRKLPPPEFCKYPGLRDDMHSVQPSPRTEAQLKTAGLPYSQAMAVAEHGDFGSRLDPF